LTSSDIHGLERERADPGLCRKAEMQPRTPSEHFIGASSEELSWSPNRELKAT
jgi:hypothetical protein